MDIRSIAAFCLVCTLFSSALPALAQDADIGEIASNYNGPASSGRPGELYFNRGVVATRNKDFGFAIQMYQAAASWAYKPAQYNLGVMYAKGQGVAVDLPRALAWMALAAERGRKDYVSAREAVYASMSDAQFAQANQIWRELKPTYADAVALQRAKTRWRDELRSATGSHVGYVGNLTLGADTATGSPQKTPGFVSQYGDTRQHSISTTDFESTSGSQIQGSVAYRQLQESDNPYDPKFDLNTGTAIVGPPIPVDPENAKDKDKPAQDPADEPHND